MAVSGTVPSTRRQGFDPMPMTRRLRRATWVLAVICFALFFVWFGLQRVPKGMDTVPEIPPGSLCIIDRRQAAARIGSNVFVDVPGGGTVLSQITAMDADTFRVMHPNALSALPDSRVFGALPRQCLRSTVLVVFPPDTGNAVPSHGR